MIILDSTTESLEILLAGAVTTNQLPFTASYADHNATAPSFTPGSSDGQTNSTTAVTLVGNPGAGVQRQVKRLNVYNADTAQVTVTIRLNNGGTLRTIIVVTLLPGDRIEYEDSTGFRVFDSTGALRSGSTLATVTSLKNLLINGSFRINQRVFAGGALAAGVYGYDRWKAGAGGCNVTVNGTTFVVTHTSGPLVQVIESPRLAGQVVTVSVENPSGSVSVNVDGQTGTITAGTGRRGATVTVPIGSTGNVTLTLTATGVTYSDVQLERGPFATTFEQRPTGVEVALCQRYYQKSYAAGTAPGSVTVSGSAPAVYDSSGVLFGQRFNVPMRVAPAITVYSTGTGAAGAATLVNGGGDVLTGLVADQISDTGWLRVNVGAGGTPGSNYRYQFVCDAEL